jgi:hypothetical protein
MVTPPSPHVAQAVPKLPLVASRSVDSVPSLPPRSPHPGRPTLLTASEPSPTSRSLNITELTLSSAAAALRSPHQRLPAHARLFSSLSQSVDLGKKVETYRLDGGGESGPGLKPWHSQGFKKNLPEVANFPLCLEDNVQFSKQLEVPKEK